ncbi:MAG: FAD-dependent oxidoreductase [Coriobacteriales bacterium]|jgi:NADPH-dependent 2,4-dienoyl-CoA reductase/sulfur reductase-like enzyme/rhodanese-related sulfurtransferase|nr:FAD-dependent oxidoreductase [Coriobacteriales bacterium]
MAKYLIVGGVAGGATAAARLRRLDETAEIIIFERGGSVSYANCGLPYHIGGVIPERGGLLLQTAKGFYDRYRVEVRLGQEVTAIDRANKRVTVKRLDSVDGGQASSGESYEEGYDKLLLAPGAHPTMPEADDEAKSQIFSLHTIADMDRVIDFIDQRQAARAVVIGGGFIGLETAENLIQRGLEVTLVQRSGQVMPPLDAEMAGLLHEKLKAGGVNLMLNSPIQGIHKDGDALKIELASGQSLSTDFIIAAIGVKPLNTLAVDAGLAIGKSGGISVDAQMRSSDPDIYAVGDAVEITNLVTQGKQPVALAGPANKQARIAADNICGIPSLYKGSQASSVLKVFEATAAMTGINEKLAKAEGLDYDKVYLFGPSHAGYYPGSQEMLIKVLFEKPSGRILGAQIVGQEGSDKRADILATAIRSGYTATDLTELELCYAPPYSSAKDPVIVAGLMIENLLTGKVSQFHWHDVADLPRDGSVQLLDVRTMDEHSRGAIEGFKNIPVDELRERLSELDQKRPVYLHCQSGLRSYIATRILLQNGFKARHLNGGYKLYKMFMQKG